MTTQEAAERLRRLRAELGASRAEDALTASFDAVALIRSRIQTKGEDYLGSTFSDYAPEYAKYGRLDLGYQADRKDYTRTGKLMRSLSATVTAENPEAVTITIAPDNPADQNKLLGAAKKDGNIIRMSARNRELTFNRFRDLRTARINTALR